MDPERISKKGLPKWYSSIFKHDFVLLPIHYKSHWTLVGLWNLGQTVIGTTPQLFYFDSLGFDLPPHLLPWLSSFVIMARKQQLLDDWKMKNQYKPDAQVPPSVFQPRISNQLKVALTRFHRPTVVTQENYYDCGCFVLEYARRLLRVFPFHINSCYPEQSMTNIMLPHQRFNASAMRNWLRLEVAKFEASL